jgi:hypothetical protein
VELTESTKVGSRESKNRLNKPYEAWRGNFGLQINGFKIDQSCADGVGGKQGDVGSTSEENEMTFWLILITAVGTNGSATVTHIGNFSSLANCQNFARSATYPVTPPSLQDYAKIKMLCVQANDAQTKPPND